MQKSGKGSPSAAPVAEQTHPHCGQFGDVQAAQGQVVAVEGPSAELRDYSEKQAQFHHAAENGLDGQAQRVDLFQSVEVEHLELAPALPLELAGQVDQEVEPFDGADEGEPLVQGQHLEEFVGLRAVGLLLVEQPEVQVQPCERHHEEQSSDEDDRPLLHRLFRQVHPLQRQVLLQLQQQSFVHYVRNFRDGGRLGSELEKLWLLLAVAGVGVLGVGRQLTEDGVGDANVVEVEGGAAEGALFLFADLADAFGADEMGVLAEQEWLSVGAIVVEVADVASEFWWAGASVGHVLIYLLLMQVNLKGQKQGKGSEAKSTHQQR